MQTDPRPKTRSIRRLEVKVLDFLAARPERRLLVACSGGPDSLALLDVLSTLRARLGVEVAAATVDHGLRPGSRAECEGVLAFCAAREVPARLLPLGLGKATPAVAREARYAALLDEARRIGADGVAVAHTADDQLETVLDHLIRGAGLRGLAGMAPVRPLGEGVALLRPLLGVERREIVAYGIARELQPVEDPSNRDLGYRRARLRHEVVALLRRERADLAAATSALCTRLADDEAALQQASRAVDAHDRRALVAAPAALRVRALERLVGAAVSSEQQRQFERLLARSDGTQRLQLDGRRWLVRCYDRVGIETAGEDAGQVAAAPSPLSPSLQARLAAVAQRWRPWQRGDRILLRRHRRLLSDLFIDAKLPRAARARVRVLEAATGTDGGFEIWAIAVPADAGGRLPPVVERDVEGPPTRR